MFDEDEILDLVNADDEVVRSIARGEYYADPEQYAGLNLRAADLFIQNDVGELWIPRRTLDRKIAPGGLDYSCGGHVGSGETYIVGLLREIEEELNLRLQPNELNFIAKLGPRPGLPYFSELYLFKSNAAPDYNPQDFSEFQWISPSNLMKLLQAGEPAKSSMLETLQIVIDKL